MSENWIELKLAGQLTPGKPVLGKDPDGAEYAVSLVDDRLFVCDNACLHQGAPLSDGYLLDGNLICSHHGWEFELASGRCLDYDGCLKTYRCRRHQGKIEIQRA